MVLLTYQGGPPSATSALSDEDTTENERLLKDDGPKTAYIDKLGRLQEEDALEEKCDLFFICKDGEIPAHRLVVSNASKFIMAMQDDQPPWYPVYISVPDLTKEIVQTLVQLAYTGKMNLPSSTTPDELLDAMQALGWVNSDCLTATYTDSTNPLSEEEFGTAVATKTAESMETVLRMSFPLSTKEEADASDDENGMELDVPDVPLSDEDEKSPSPKQRRRATKKEPVNSSRSTRATRSNQPNSEPVDPEPKRQRKQRAEPVTVDPEPKKPRKKAEPQDAEPKTSRKKAEPEDAEPKTPKKQQKSQTTAPRTASSRSKAQPTTPAKSETQKGKKNVESNAEPATPNEKPAKDTAAEPATSPEAVRSSRTRTIRQPKRFEDAIVLTPTKRKESPVKAPPKASAKAPSKKEAETGSSDNSKASNNTPNNIANKPGGRARRNVSVESKEAIRSSLITSYFSKRNSRTSDDNLASGNIVSSENTDNGNSSELKNDDKPLKDENGTDNETERQNDVEGKPEEKNENDTEATEKGTNDVGSPAAASRGRSKSNASTKEEKDSTEDINDDSAGPKRKRSTNDNGETNEETETSIPAKRGRKASTISNASKSSNKNADT